ncbi:N-acyl-D-amino-acid deacylase family protein [Sciscionella marina]|uniref:N-acyl-D-amino-acid deacylase family protein n=1 Tax=Sciscionella marina TaxID=508770 RepID=UPI00036741F8|nr:D-aminoacylase [Sciscionella marina]
MRLDLLLRGGLLVDGTGAPAREADIGVRAGRLCFPGPGAEAERVLDVPGLAVAPGFIDAHTHSDGANLLDPARPELTLAPVRQGVTTEICGNCGFGMFPAGGPAAGQMRAQARVEFGGDVGVFADFPAFAAGHARVPRSTNLSSLVGHGTLRASVLGYADRPAEADELDRMRAALDAALRAGAAGLSTGLIYPPGTYADTGEVVALAEIAARHGKPYVTHMRDEMSQVETALAEAVEIAERSGAALHVSHHKTAGKFAWGRTGKTLPLLDELRAGGLDVSCDVYPYTAGSTGLAAMLPPWASEGGTAALIERLGDPEQLDRMRAGIENGVPGWENTVGNGGWDRVDIACAPSEPGIEGTSLAELAAHRGTDPLSVAASLLRADGGAVMVISHSMREDDVQRVLASPLSVIGSDGVPKPGHPHPRLAGTFPRVLGHYHRELGLFSLETAVHKMTGATAARFGLAGRGVLTEGAHADLMVFDPETIIDRASYTDPLLAPDGVHHVLVGGTEVLRAGTDTGARPGRVLASE